MRRNEDDRLELMDAKKGKFTVKSLYSFLGQERAVPFSMKVIWNLIVQSKIGFFVWEAF